jgi:multiple sugar transport system substrate-binding protein
MTDELRPFARSLSRRNFLGVSGAAVAAGLLAGCSAGGGGGGGGSSSKTLKFWDMTWGVTDAYNADAKAVVAGFTQSGAKAAYQTVSWTNFNQTFATAIASRTGPAVSSGGGFQAFQFAGQGAIAYADNLLASMKTSGLYADFVDGTWDSMKTPKGYAAVPWNLDVVVLWYRKSVLDAAGITSLPQTWDQYHTVAETLAKKGHTAFGAGNGSDNSFGYEPLLAWMINNGGGLFAPDGTLDVVSARNIEAIEFIYELVKMGAVDPGAVSYSVANYNAKWSDKTIGIGWYDGYLDANLNAVGDILVADPLAGPHGDKGTIQYVNNLMMYTNTPSQELSEAFVTYYIQNLHVLWEKKVVPELPPLKSILNSASFQSDTQATKIAQKWQPVAKTLAAQSVPLTAQLAAIDGGTAAFNFASTVLAGKGDAKSALVAFEKGIKSAVSS